MTNVTSISDVYDDVGADLFDAYHAETKEKPKWEDAPADERSRWRNCARLIVIFVREKLQETLDEMKLGLQPLEDALRELKQ